MMPNPARLPQSSCPSLSWPGSTRPTETTGAFIVTLDGRLKGGHDIQPEAA